MQCSNCVAASWTCGTQFAVLVCELLFRLRHAVALPTLQSCMVMLLCLGRWSYIATLLCYLQSVSLCCVCSCCCVVRPGMLRCFLLVLLSFGVALLCPCSCDVALVLMCLSCLVHIISCCWCACAVVIHCLSLVF